tara:strand:+ start:62 stop:274 length:213 start_codon:yes stop_codon:yes gene_type:complete
MKLILEVELTSKEKKSSDPESVLVQKMYNTCNDWLNGDEIPKLIFVYDDDEYDDLESELYNLYNKKNNLN